MKPLKDVNSTPSTYNKDLGVTIDCLAPGMAFGTTAEAKEAVRAHGCTRFTIIICKAPKKADETRCKLWKEAILPLAKQGYKHMAYAVGALDTEHFGERGGRKIVVGVMPK